MKYTIVDSNYNFVNFKNEDYYELVMVDSKKAYEFLMERIADAEINNINRIVKNADYYNIYVDPKINFQLLVKGIERIVKIIELEDINCE